jgi:hypothetical protein
MSDLMYAFDILLISFIPLILLVTYTYWKEKQEEKRKAEDHIHKLEEEVEQLKKKET